MSLREQALSDFIDAWNAGRRPRVLDCLRRVPEGPERDALAESIETWLTHAPTPELSPPDREAVRDTAAVRRVLEVVGEDAALWPVALPRLRARAGLSVRDVATALVDRFDLGGAAEIDRAAAYLDEMEQGSRRADRVSRRLLDALGAVLGISGPGLADLGGAAGVFRPAPEGGLLFRADDDAEDWLAEHIELLARAARTPAPEPMDELDRLFAGGPDA